MIFYKLIEGSYSYDINDTSEFANLYTKEDVINWADDVSFMITLEDENGDEFRTDGEIDKAIDILNMANEFLEEVELIGGTMNNKKEYTVLVDIGSIGVCVEAESEEDAMQKAIEKIQNDPDYYEDMEFSALVEYVDIEEVD